MIEHRHQPVGGSVTTVAGQAGRNMIGAHAGADDTIMTLGTGLAGNRGMIETHQPVIGVVAGIASGRGGNMVGALARGNHAIMATGATANNLAVIHQRIHWRPGRGVMAGRTVVAGLDVVGVFARGNSAFVATDTGLPGNSAVIKADRPVVSVVATVTGINRDNMVCSLAGRDHAIMTTVTGPQYLLMINERIHRRPGRSVMTGLAECCAVDVICRFTRGSAAIVTTDAGLPHHNLVIKRNIPVHGVVATVAGQRGRQVRGSLARGNHSVVTALATADDMIVIHVCRVPANAGAFLMAVLTDIGRWQVGIRFASGH